MSCNAPPDVPPTSSTWATACSSKPTRSACGRWWTWCTSGARRVPDTPDAVLLVASGAPLSLDEVEAYLLDVRGGRPTPGDLLEEVRARYAAIGGRSPLLDRTREQAEALRRWFGNGTPVLVGMRHWHPYIKDVLADAAQRGIRRAVAVAMAPHYSRMSIGAYQRKVDEARGAPALPSPPAGSGAHHLHGALPPRADPGLRGPIPRTAPRQRRGRDDAAGRQPTPPVRHTETVARP